MAYCSRMNLQGEIYTFYRDMLLCTATLPVLSVIGGVEQNPGLGVEAGNWKFSVVGATGYSNLEHNAPHVDVCFTTAVETSRLRWLKAGSGAVIGADGIGLVNSK
jgi:hypothetical protein